MADIIQLPRLASWTGIGSTINEKTVDTALTKAKLNYTVQKETLWLTDKTKVDDMVANTYLDEKGHKHILGVVGEKYEIVQNLRIRGLHQRRLEVRQGWHDSHRDGLPHR